MDDLQYLNRLYTDWEYTQVLNLVINGWPSIHTRFWFKKDNKS